MFQTRVLRNIFVPKREEVTEGWMKLNNEKCKIFYSLLNIFRIIKSRRMRWAGHTENVGRREMYTKI
jgi:hypothetical protein